MAKVNRLKLAKRMELYDLLKDVCQKSDDGHAAYSAGWGDNRVAAQVGVNVESVKYMRQELFGSLRKTKQAKTKLSRWDVVEDLMRRVEYLETQLGVQQAA